MPAEPFASPGSSPILRDNTEISLAPREGELLSLPFDQYGRMRVAQNIMLALHSEIIPKVVHDGAAGAVLRVLDVGGYPGILRHFLPESAFDVSVIDVVPDDGKIPGYTQGSGMDLPFDDSSFDIVTSLDTLEHIPNPSRERFLSEVMRVARCGIMLINPVQSIQTDLAEETLDEYIRWILDAQQEQLAEHRAFGLPDFEATIKALQSGGWETATTRIANIYNWLFMMVAKHYLISLRTDQASAFEKTLDRFYNLTFNEGDRAEPTYRGVVVAVKPGFEGALVRLGDLYPPVASTEAANAERLQLAQLLMRLIDLKVANHEDRALREQMDRRDKHIAGMEGKIALLEDQKAALESTLQDLRNTYEVEFKKHEEYMARLEEERKNKDEHILYLERLLQGIESGRVMRLTRSISRFLGRA